MGLSANQTVKIIVTLDTNAAKRELERVHGQARMGAAKQAGAGGGGGAGIMKPGRFLRGGVRSGRTSGSLMGRAIRSGLGKTAGRALRAVGGRLGSQAARMGTGLLARAGLGAGAGATAMSAIVIGAAVKMYLDNHYPNLGENLRRILSIDKMLATLNAKQAAAGKMTEFQQAFADLGIEMPDAFRVSGAANRVAAFNADVEAQRLAIQRRNLKAAGSNVSMEEMVKRRLLGSTFGQMINSLPDARSALLKMLGMRS